MKNYSIIGDIAGNANTLKELWKKLPGDFTKILVGDLFDRGPNSKEVYEFLKDRKDCIVLYGNHEDFLIKALLSENDNERNGWLILWTSERNGGMETLESFDKSDLTTTVIIPDELIDWIKTFPFYFEDKEAGLFVSHAPLAEGNYEKIKGATHENFSRELIWDRASPVKLPGLHQVFGHNWRFKSYGYATCIDNAAAKQLLALNFPSMEITTQEVID